MGGGIGGREAWYDASSRQIGTRGTAELSAEIAAVEVDDYEICAVFRVDGSSPYMILLFK